MIPVLRRCSIFTGPEATFTVQTSGSTGTPKNIHLKKEDMEASARKTLRFLRLSRGSRSLLCLPHDRIGGLMMFVRWWVGALDLHITVPQSNPLGEVEGSFEFAAMVPYQVSRSLNELHRIEKLIIGGGSIPPVLEQKL
ncbi:MAG: hypothetical protein ACPF9D_12865, partial [Owenweeksia sp.]